MADEPIYRGWDIVSRMGRGLKRSMSNVARRDEAHGVEDYASQVIQKLKSLDLDQEDGRRQIARNMASNVLSGFVSDDCDIEDLPFFSHLADILFDLIAYEALFDVPAVLLNQDKPLRSEIWDAEAQLRRIGKIVDNLDKAMDQLAEMVGMAISPIVQGCPAILVASDQEDGEISFDTPLSAIIPDLPDALEQIIELPFAPELETFDTTVTLKARLEHNLTLASGGVPSDTRTHSKSVKMPSSAKPMDNGRLIRTYLGGTPFSGLFDFEISITIPTETRFEHHHIVAGSGHGKTQTLQHLILHDLEAVAAGKASIIVIDSQSDLIENIAGLSVFAPGQPLADRLCVIDPTDVEYPVALNLFDVGMERINQYSQLDRERLINGIIELYDFVLGSLLEAGMTQKQSIIFRYITRLMLHIPNATIHTFRELLEDDGYQKHFEHIKKLEGSARSFFENEYGSREFVQTRRQVLHRLYGILETQTFERMFSHPRSKLDLYSEMNAGKVILINTAKDLLKENGTEIFGRFFIALIAQAAQERAIMAKEDRLPTFVYIDEANDYFDRNIGIILSQARKYRIGMVLAHQFLGQLDSKLQEAISANTSVKFAGGVSAKDARALSSDLRTDPAFIEAQDKLSFAAFVKDTTRNAVSVSIQAGRMEALPRMSDDDRQIQRDVMREKYAVHYTQAKTNADTSGDEPAGDGEPDSGEPMEWRQEE